NPEKGHIISGYLGVLLLGAVFLAVGMFASSLTSNQIIAAIIAFSFLLVFWLIGAAADIAGPTIGEVLRYMAPDTYFNDFTRGVIDSRGLVYYVTLIGVFIFATVRSLETRRWR
nr:hypothetical protein [Dehalococcoidales bacterium]